MSDLFFRMLRAKRVEDLLPGRPDHLLICAHGLADWAEVLEQTGSSLRSLDAGHWSGVAADAFREKFHPHPKKWLTAADAFTNASRAVTDYAHELAAGQRRVSRALAQFHEGLEESRQAKQQHDAVVAANRKKEFAALAAGAPVRIPDPEFVDAGAVKINAAVEEVKTVEDSLFGAGMRAAETVKHATRHAPERPSTWSRVVEGVENFIGAGIDDVTKLAQAGYNDVLVPTVNGLAAYGQAMIDDPTDTVKTMGGLLLMGAGDAMEGLGGALDATVVGAPVGAALNVAGAAVIVAGGGLAIDGATGLAKQASTEDMNVMHAMSKGTRMRDPGYGKTPVRSANAPAPPPDAAPYDPTVAGKVGGWGIDSQKTQGVLVKDGEQVSLQSGRAGPSEQAPGGPGSGLNGRVKPHVEAHAGSALQSGDSATLYLNRLPCGGPTGCEANLARYVPEGAKLTVYGPDDYVQVIYGTGPR